MSARTGPLTHGQLSVLRSLAVHGPGAQAVANLTSAWEVPFGVGTAQVMDAWLRLVEAHEGLRSSYTAEGTPAQHVHPFEPSQVPAVELAEDTAAAALELAAGYAAEPIPVDAGRPWRAAVATFEGEPLYLVTAIHHVAADNAALAVLEEDFGRLLQGRDPEPGPQPLDLALAQRERPEAGERSLRHWAGVWKDLGDRDPADTSRRRRASVYSLEGLAAARKLSEDLRVSVQSVLLGVGALAVSRFEARDRPTFALMAANRVDERWARVVGSLNQYAPVTVAVDEDAHPLDFLKATYVQCLSAYMHGSYDVDALAARLRDQEEPDPEPTGFARHFNFLGGVDAEPAPGSPLLTGAQWRGSGQRTGANLHLAIAVGEGVLIGVGASERLMPGDGPARTAAAIEAGLIGIAEGSAQTLREVSLDPVRQV
jgi:hypothetical protein